MCVSTILTSLSRYQQAMSYRFSTQATCVPACLECSSLRRTACPTRWEEVSRPLLLVCIPAPPPYYQQLSRTISLLAFVPVRSSSLGQPRRHEAVNDGAFAAWRRRAVVGTAAARALADGGVSAAAVRRTRRRRRVRVGSIAPLGAVTPDRHYRSRRCIEQ